ncbi:P-loop containing nucleoside triphosphate hydrolase protein, partial [Boletus coccyginus]
MPVILLSATNPPSLQCQMLTNFGLREDRTAFIRSPTNRAELGLHVIRLDSLTESRALQHLVYALLGKLEASERMLVFFEHCDLAENFAKQNKFAVYHSKLPGTAVKSENLRSWDSGETKVMACTSAFGFGVDRPNIRFVVVFNPEFSLLTTMQMAGRAGRDGREAHVFF